MTRETVIHSKILQKYEQLSSVNLFNQITLSATIQVAIKEKRFRINNPQRVRALYHRQNTGYDRYKYITAKNLVCNFIVHRTDYKIKLIYIR